MSKLTIEVNDDHEESFEIVFLSDFGDDASKLRIDILNDRGVTLIDKELAIDKDELIVLMKYIEGFLQSH